MVTSSTAAQASLNAHMTNLERRILQQPDEARQGLLGLLAQAREQGDQPGEVYALCLVAECMLALGKYNEAVSYAEQALTKGRQSGVMLEARCLNILGLAAHHSGHYKEALELYRQSLQAANTTNDDGSRARILVSLAATFSDLEDHERSLSYYHQGEELSQRAGTPQFRAEALRGLVEELRHLGQPEQASVLLPQAFELARLVGHQGVLWRLHLLQGQLQSDQHEYSLALRSAGDGLSIAQASQDHAGQATLLCFLGETHLHREEDDPAFLALARSERLAEATGLQSVLSATKKALAILSERRGEYKVANSYWKEHLAWQDELRSTSVQHRAEVLTGQLKAEMVWRETELERHKHTQLQAAHSVLERAQSDLHYHANHDRLTGTLNRTAFWREGQALLSQPHACLGLLHADIDGLHGVNEEHGYAAGDQVLLEVAERLRQLAGDTLIGRLDGDEFMLLTHLAAADDIDQLANRVVQIMDQPFTVAGREVPLRLSLGSVTSPADGTTLDTLHRNSSLALQEAKVRDGQQSVRFHPDMSTEEQARRRIMSDLKVAVAEGQFELYYQAKFALPTRAVTGFEGLLRWNHPELGLISPMKFIPLAEANGMIFQVSEWILNEACHQAREWNLAGRHLTMAVNISPLQFNHPDFARMIGAALEQHGLPGGVLVVEITEGMVHENLESAVATTERLRGMGVRVAMDDFGTGYSSLSMLKHLPLDKLKIDRLFLSDLLPNHPDFTRARHFMTAIITLAHHLGLKVVAEGVETGEQLQLLTELGCDEAQGYHLAHPSAPGEARALLPAFHQDNTRTTTHEGSAPNVMEER